ncbi:hypothetical protein OROMI_015252 [Orobanche minor]
MASSPNVRPSPNSATGADAESAAVADAAAASAAAATTTVAENQSCLEEANMRGSKCSINGYVRLGIVKTINAELRSVGDDTFREFRESCLGHFIRGEWGGFVSNAALHALFSNEVVRPDAQVDEFWFKIGHRLIQFSRYEYALVTGLRFGDSDFDVHGYDVPPEGSVYDRWLWTLILVTYLSDVPTEIWACEAIPSLGSKCGIMLGASFIQRPRCTRWKLKKLGHIDFTTFFDDEIDCFEVLSPTPEEEQEPSAVQEMRQYVDAVVEKSVKDIAPRTRPYSSTADLSPITFEYSSTTIPADTYHSPRLQYRSYRPHSPFSTTVVRKRKDLDEEAYRRWLDSVSMLVLHGASASWFFMLQDTSKLIDAEHLDAYMGILQFDPGFVGVRWLDDWAAQTILVHTSFLATCINVWNDSKRKGGPLSIDDEDLDFLVSHIHGLRPFWADHRLGGSYARNVLTIWNTSPESSCGHWLVLRIRLEEGIIIMHDSLAQEEDAYLKLRSHQSLGISFLIPTILQRSGFYERRLDITPVPQFRVVIPKKDLCYVQDDSTSCGALSIRTLESLVQHSFSQGKTEMDIYAFRGRMARAIWSFSDDADIVVCDPTSLFIRFDDRN